MASKNVATKTGVAESRDAASALRDVKNWLAVFKTEYDISEEALEVLHGKLDELGSKLGEPGKGAASALRDVKNWLAVFAKEYDIAGEAVSVLHENLDKVGDKLAAMKK